MLCKLQVLIHRVHEFVYMNIQLAGSFIHGKSIGTSSQYKIQFNESKVSKN